MKVGPPASVGRLPLPTSESVIRDVELVRIDSCSLGRSAAWVAEVLSRLVQKFELYLYLKHERKDDI